MVGSKRKRPTPVRNRPLMFGRDDWIRTSDPLTPSQVRYQAAPHPDFRPEGHLLFYAYALARLPRLAAAAAFPDPRLVTCLAMTRDFGRASSDRLTGLATAGGVSR